MGTPQNQKNLKTPLSTIRKGPVKGLRNILTHPQEFAWPICRDDRDEILQNTLTELLPEQKKTRSISWAKLRKMSKEERAALKKENQCKNAEKDHPVISQLLLGVNAVTRALEKDNVASVLLDCNVDPLMMIKHVIMMGQNKKIPVLLVPFLKSATLNRLGFASAALGIQKSSIEDKDSQFYKLHEKISTTLEQLPKHPVDLFNNFEDSMYIDEDAVVSEEAPQTMKKPSEPFKLSPSVYLHRTSAKQRTFVPPNSQPQTSDSWSDFISLGDIDMTTFSAEQTSKNERYVNVHEAKMSPPPKNPKIEKNEHNQLKVNKENKAMYRPLKVKRVQGNPKRLKATKLPKTKKKSAKKIN